MQSLNCSCPFPRQHSRCTEKLTQEGNWLWLHLMLSTVSTYTCRSSVEVPRCYLMGAFKSAQADLSSWIWTPVTGSTKLSAWTTALCRVTWLGKCCSIPSYAPLSSVCTSLPGRRHLAKMGRRVAWSLLLKNLKYPFAGRVSHENAPNPHMSRSLFPLLYSIKNTEIVNLIP